MRVVCAWCGVLLSESQAGPVSHGICASCSLTVERAFLKTKVVKNQAPRRPSRHRTGQAPTLPLPGFLSAGRA